MVERVRDRRADLGLSASSVDADIVLREGRTLWAPAAVLLLWGIHELVHPHHDSWLEKAAFIGASVAAVLVEFVLYPAWITIGPRGVAYGQWFQRRRFLWGDIEAFALGNPGRPEVAYVLVRPDAASSAPRAARLPRLSSHSPEQLVSVLRAKQRLFTERGTRSSRGEHEKSAG
jgi:hypothetical protein